MTSKQQRDKMSRSYHIEIDINKQFTEENIRKILTDMHNQGASFYRYDLEGIYELREENKLVINEVLQGNTELNRYEIILKYDETAFFVLFNQENQVINMYIFGFFYTWEKSFKDCRYEELDMAKYSNLIFMLLSKYQILEFKIEKS
jgi:hypothetical protein